MSLLSKISTGLDQHYARLDGIGLMLLSIFMFSFGDALGKFMVATYSVGQLLWLRACAALIVLLPMIWRHRAEFMRLERPWLQLLRVTLSTLEVAAFFSLPSICRSPTSSLTIWRLPFSSRRCRRSCFASMSACGAGARFCSASA